MNFTLAFAVVFLVLFAVTLASAAQRFYRVRQQIAERSVSARFLDIAISDARRHPLRLRIDVAIALLAGVLGVSLGNLLFDYERWAGS